MLEGIGPGMAVRPGGPRRALAVGLAAALLGPASLHLLPDLGGPVAGEILLSNVSMWVLAAAVLWLVLRWERRPLSSIGLEWPSGRLVLLAIGGGVGVTVAGLVITGALVSLSVIRQPPEGLAVLDELSAGHRVMLVITAAVTEEILYRGYPIERLGELTSLWLGAVVAGAVFLAVHFPFWGPAAVPMQATATVGLVGLYVWRRNLPAAMIAHATIDTLLLLVLPALI